MVASPIFKLAGKLASNLASRSGSGLPRIEKIFGTPPRVPFPSTVEKIARSDEAFARGPVQPPSRYSEIGEDVDEVILDTPLTRPEREYFTNLPRTGSGFFEKKLTAKDVEFFDDMIREGDPYEFMLEIPSAKIRTDKKGNKYLRVQGEEDMNNLFKFIEDGPWDKGELPPSLRRWDWDKSFKDIKEFKHGGGLSSIDKPITINGQRHNLAWIRPDEASALKAMGGSGKKVDGIPAYFDAYSMGETPLAEELYSVPEPETADDVEQFIQDRERLTAKDYADLPKAFTYEAGDYEQSEDDPTSGHWNVKTDQDDFWNRPSDDPTEYQKLYDRPELNTVKTQLIERLGGPGMEKYMKGLGTSGLRNVINKFHTGWDFGGPMGTVEGISRDMATVHASKLGLKEYMKKLKDLEGEELSDEKREERLAEIYSDLSKTARDTGGVFTKRKRFGTGGIMGDLEQTLKDHGLSPHWNTAAKFFPGQSLTKAPAYIANAITNLVGHLGTFTTKEGKEFSLRDTGKLIEQDMAAIPTEDSPEPVTEIARAVAPSPEVVAEAGPMETYQTGLQSIESNEGINNSIQILMDQYGISESEARVMLGENVNIA